jgi:hypothetical protein
VQRIHRGAMSVTPEAHSAAHMQHNIPVLLYPGLIHS